MGHRALTRQKRKCRLARQMSMTMLTMQVRAMASCTGRSMARKGKATMAPPMPLTPETKPPAIQARNTQISVIPGIRPSCGHGPPPSVHEKSNYLSARSALSTDSHGRDDSHGETIPPCGNSRSARHEPGGVSRPSAGDGLYRRALHRMRLPAPQGAARACGSLPHHTASLSAKPVLPAGAFRPRPLPCPSRTYAEQVAAQSMLREVAAFWQQEEGKKA